MSYSTRVDRRFSIGVLLAVCLLLVLPAWAEAITGPGRLDPSFGSKGRSVIVPSVYTAVGEIGQQKSGKVVVGITHPTSVGVLRTTSTGALDKSFGVGGETTLPVKTDRPELVVQSDGKIVVAATIFEPNLHPAGVLIARFLPEGQIDSSFAGGGQIVVKIAGQSDEGTLGGLAIGPQGKISIALSAATPASDSQTIALHRFLTTGDPDPGFGTGGKIETNPGCCFAISDLYARGDGNLVMASWISGNTRPGVSTTGKAGLVTPGSTQVFGTEVLLGPGPIEALVGPPNGSTWGIGGVDRSGEFRPPGPGNWFATRAGSTPGASQTTLQFAVGKPDQGQVASAAVHDSQSRIVIAGTYLPPKANFLTGTRVALKRLTAAGTVDRTFGNNGTATASLPGVNSVYGPALTAANDNRFVVAGPSSIQNNNITLLRYFGGADRTRPKATLKGLHRVRCGTRLPIRIKIADSSPLARVKITYAGRNVRAKRTASFLVRIRERATRRRLTIGVRDLAGNRSKRHVTVPACRR